MKGPGNSRLTIRAGMDLSNHPDDFIRKVWKAERHRIDGSFEETGSQSNAVIVGSMNRSVRLRKRRTEWHVLVEDFLKRRPDASAKEVANYLESQKGLGIIDDVERDDDGQITAFGWMPKSGKGRNFKYSTLKTFISDFRRS